MPRSRRSRGAGRWSGSRRSSAASCASHFEAHAMTPRRVRDDDAVSFAIEYSRRLAGVRQRHPRCAFKTGVNEESDGSGVRAGLAHPRRRRADSRAAAGTDLSPTRPRARPRGRRPRRRGQPGSSAPGGARRRVRERLPGHRASGRGTWSTQFADVEGDAGSTMRCAIPSRRGSGSAVLALATALSAGSSRGVLPRGGDRAGPPLLADPRRLSAMDYDDCGWAADRPVITRGRRDPRRHGSSRAIR